MFAKLRKWARDKHGTVSLSGAAIGVGVLLVTAMIMAVIFFNIAENVPTNNNSNATAVVSSMTNYFKISIGFIGLGAFVLAAFLIIGVIRGGGGGTGV